MALHVQNQIRNNAEEVNGFFQDMVKWEKDIKTKDKNIIQKKLTKRTRAAAGQSTRQGAGTVAVSTTVPVDKGTSAANHTYDVGYKKWENIKISESDELEEDDTTHSVSIPVSTNLTPATLAALPGAHVSPSKHQVPKALGKASNVDIETYERERGNAEFKTGNFANAIKCYTKCLGLKPKNYVAFSNRAMAYLKQKEHHKAEVCRRNN
jgi:tetratricopeptide (TPR) repeat protein